MAIEFTDTQTDRTPLNVEGQVFEITKSVNFEAAHYMQHKPDGHPYKNLHGHSFRLEATVSGKVKPHEEWVQDFSELTAALKETAKHLDHRLLNEIPGLDVPTMERICLWAANDLKSRLTGLSKVKLSRPSLNETCTLVIS
ncbi:MAG: 6-carboxytetrahydropterin synthase QueD [Pseudomonadota bacterium]